MSDQPARPGEPSLVEAGATAAPGATGGLAGLTGAALRGPPFAGLGLMALLAGIAAVASGITELGGFFGLGPLLVFAWAGAVCCWMMTYLWLDAGLVRARGHGPFPSAAASWQLTAKAAGLSLPIGAAIAVSIFSMLSAVLGGGRNHQHPDPEIVLLATALVVLAATVGGGAASWRARRDVDPSSARPSALASSRATSAPGWREAAVWLWAFALETALSWGVMLLALNAFSAQIVLVPLLEVALGVCLWRWGARVRLLAWVGLGLVVVPGLAQAFALGHAHGAPLSLGLLVSVPALLLWSLAILLLLNEHVSPAGRYLARLALVVRLTTSLVAAVTWWLHRAGA